MERYAAFLLLLLWIGSVQGPDFPEQEIKVRLVDARNGHLLANQAVHVQFHVPQVPELQTLEDKTGADGVATFHLPLPVPANIAAFTTSDQLYPCYKTFPINTNTLIHEGIVSRCHKPEQGCYCKFARQVSDIQNKPGELVLPARPFTRWEKLMRHVWE